ncbi:hypothetical protein D3C75_468200 [compost metagenome]
MVRCSLSIIVGISPRNFNDHIFIIISTIYLRILPSHGIFHIISTIIQISRAIIMGAAQYRSGIGMMTKSNSNRIPCFHIPANPPCNEPVIAQGIHGNAYLRLSPCINTDSMIRRCQHGVPRRIVAGY